MASRYSWLALAVLAASLVGLTSCQRTSAAQPATQTISLSYNNGSCQQNGSSEVIEVSQSQPVVFQGANTLTQFQVQFSSCPLSSCPVSSPNGAAVNVGQPTGTVGTTYNYSSITINNQSCNSGVGAMGLRVKP